MNCRASLKLEGSERQVVSVRKDRPVLIPGAANVLHFHQNVFGKNIPTIICQMVFWAHMHPVAGTVLAIIFAEISLNRFVAGANWKIALEYIQGRSLEILYSLSYHRFCFSREQKICWRHFVFISPIFVAVAFQGNNFKKYRARNNFSQYSAIFNWIYWIH